VSFEPYEGIAPPESDPAIALEQREDEELDCGIEQDIKLSSLIQVMNRTLIMDGDELLRVRMSRRSPSKCIILYRRENENPK
jgi:hypothetical protein